MIQSNFVDAGNIYIKQSFVDACVVSSLDPSSSGSCLQDALRSMAAISETGDLVQWLHLSDCPLQPRKPPVIKPQVTQHLSRHLHSTHEVPRIRRPSNVLHTRVITSVKAERLEVRTCCEEVSENASAIILCVDNAICEGDLFPPGRRGNCSSSRSPCSSSLPLQKHWSMRKPRDC